MKKHFFVLTAISLLFFCVVNSSAQYRLNNFSQNSEFEKLSFKSSTPLQNLLDEAIKKTLTNFKETNLKSEEIAATLIDMRNPQAFSSANYRGNERIYPASVVKMFYMAALYRWLEDGKIKMTPELQRGLEDMIINSGNESTGYILDALTETTSGPEMPENEFKEWSFKRNAVNRYFNKLGYTNINVNQKPHCEDAWGREQQFRNYKGENRNMLTTDATAKLLTEIVVGFAANEENTKKMMGLMKREWEKPSDIHSGQEFISYALKPGTKLWTKEGWTSKTRHDAAYIETPDGLKFVLVIFTENHATEQEIIPSVARVIINGLEKIK